MALLQLETEGTPGGLTRVHGAALSRKLLAARLERILPRHSADCDPTASPQPAATMIAAAVAAVVELDEGPKAVVALADWILRSVIPAADLNAKGRVLELRGSVTVRAVPHAPAVAPVYLAEAVLNERTSEATAPSKKAAEQEAALRLLEALGCAVAGATERPSCAGHRERARAALAECCRAGALADAGRGLAPWHAVVGQVPIEEVLPQGLGAATAHANAAAFVGDKLLGAAVALALRRTPVGRAVGRLAQRKGLAVGNAALAAHFKELLPGHGEVLVPETHDAGTMVEAAVEAVMRREGGAEGVAALAQWLLDHTAEAPCNPKGRVLELGGVLEVEAVPGLPSHAPLFTAKAMLGGREWMAQGVLRGMRCGEGAGVLTCAWVNPPTPTPTRALRMRLRGMG